MNSNYPKTAKWWLDVELVFDRFIGRNELIELQSFLVANAPEWSRDMRVWLYQGNQRPVDLNIPDSLFERFFAAAEERGPLYQQLVENYGRGNERVFGGAEIRGSSMSLIVIASVDATPIVKMLNDGSVFFGNSISFQLRTKTAASVPSPVWARAVITHLCHRLNPVWGSAHSSLEYDAKIMSDGTDGFYALGRDFGEYLPGLFWLNYFGGPYVKLIGFERLLTAPASVSPVGEGVVVELPCKPSEWSSPEYLAAEAAALEHIGREYFFDKRNQNRLTSAPLWPL